MIDKCEAFSRILIGEELKYGRGGYCYCAKPARLWISVDKPVFRYDIIDAVKDREGPFLCRPKIIDLRSDIPTQSLENMGWAVTIHEQEENHKVQEAREMKTPRPESREFAFLRDASHGEQ